MQVGFFQRTFGHIDWIIPLAAAPLLGAGLVTMESFVGESGFFAKQLVWILVSFTAFLLLSLLDFRFLRKTSVVTGIFAVTLFVLLALFAIGAVFHGAQSWFDFGFFAFQPSDIAKLVLIIVLAKYFSRRHEEIANYKHIVISGLYAFLFFILVFLQPDFGSAIIIFAIWFGMVLASGIPKKHLGVVLLVGIIAFSYLWFFTLADYQKARITTFLNPLTDISGAGYNARQSTIAVGSGGFLGKGVGYGTQSRLEFLPEYQTDFIFAAFTEEWGFVGAVMVFLLFGIIIWRVLRIASRGETNFETLFAVGVVIMFLSHFVIHVGMNIGLLPITGLTIPFMSYGGSHLLSEFSSLGILMGMDRYGKESRYLLK